MATSTDPVYAEHAAIPGLVAIARAAEGLRNGAYGHAGGRVSVRKDAYVALVEALMGWDTDFERDR